MKIKSFILVILLTITSSLNYLFGQDFLAFTAIEAQGYGAYATTFGHNIPVPGICGLAIAYASLASADQAPAAQFPGMKAGLKLAAGGNGFANFNNALVNEGYSLTDVEMKFTSMDLGDDIQNQDWFVIGNNETRFYQDGTFTFYVDGAPIISGNMPVLQIEIAYNDAANCVDDIISGLTQYTAVVDASGGQLQKFQDIAAAFLADVGNNGIRFNFGNMEPAAQGVSGAVFQAVTGSIELGNRFDNLGGINISLPSPNLCLTPSIQVISSGSENWLHVLEGGNRVVSILDSENMGSISTDFYINSGSIRSTTGGLKYMDRNFTITPTIQPSGNIRVRLYFTDDEWTDFIAANPTDLEFMSEFKISKFSSSDCSAINNASGEVTVDLLDYGYIPNDESYFVDIEVSSFSTFFIHGPKNTNVLPVELLDFYAEKQNEYIRLNWQTATEINNSHFDVEWSTDGLDFEKIGEIAGNGTTTETHFYNFLHKNPANGINYYRLRQVDFDGQFEYTDILNIEHSREIGESNFQYQIYPNPTSDFILIDGIEAGEIVQIFNIYGQLIQEFQIQTYSNQYPLSSLQAGTYFIKINTKVKKLIITK